jgi:multidrug resistance efflux pump
VKIVQRLPVRIELVGDDAMFERLRLGLSAEVTVDTRETGD